jgi:hypothetical protein
VVVVVVVVVLVVDGILIEATVVVSTLRLFHILLPAMKLEEKDSMTCQEWRRMGRTFEKK